MGNDAPPAVRKINDATPQTSIPFSKAPSVNTSLNQNSEAVLNGTNQEANWFDP